MLRTTLQALIFEQWQPDEGSYCLYILRDPTTIFYIGQAPDPCQQIKAHLDTSTALSRPSRIGQWILGNSPLALSWTVELLGLADMGLGLAGYRPPSLVWWQRLYTPEQRDPWEAVYQAEYALIRYYRPCLNERYNQGAGRTPVPPPYRYPYPERS